MMSLHWLIALIVLQAGDGPGEARIKDASDSFFASDTVPRIRIEVEEQALKQLAGDQRNYVTARLREEGMDPVAEVGIKLKGAAGSFREWNDRPALTVNVRKFRKGNQYHDLIKFHLNNSVQDETYLHEILCSELFRQAGVPAPRVGFARVWLNDRDVGLYVVKEGFDRPFLHRWFADSTGNLYDGGFLQDLDADLEKDEGTGPDDRRDLRAIVEAAAESDSERRRERLEALIDLNLFASFMAMERMTGHWDGYVDKANNYRIYFDPGRGDRAVFLPHGMDQMFGDPETGLFQDSDKIVPRALLRDPRFRQRYRQRVAQLVPLMAPADGLIRRIDEITGRIKPALQAIGPDVAARHAEAVADLKQRLIARAANLPRLLAEPEETLLTFDDQGVAGLADGWRGMVKSGEADLKVEEMEPGRRAWRIEAKGSEPTEASWRRRLLLDPGQYTWLAEVRTANVVGRGAANEGGVGIGRSGTARAQHVVGSQSDKLLVDRFEVRGEPTRVELVLELRGRSGTVWFDARSLRLLRQPLPGGD